MTALPTYDNALNVPTLAATTADLLSRLDPTTVAGWPSSSPQMRLVSSEAAALQFEQLQRAIITRTASPAQLRALRAWLMLQGYSAADAAAVTSAWVDVALRWYSVTRIPAQQALWSVQLLGSGVTDVSTMVLQADDGTLFVSAQKSVDLPRFVGFKARTPGAAGNVITGTISHVMSAPAGVTLGSGAQTLLFAGRDAETDEAALDRADAKWDTLGAGYTARAFDFLIPLYAPTLTRWYVDDANPYGPNSIGVWLANEAGPATVGEVAAVRAGLTSRDARPWSAGRTVVRAAPAHPLALAATLQSDGSNSALAANASAAVVQLGRAFPLGPASLVVALAEAVLFGASVGSVTIPRGAGSVVITPNLPGFGGVEDITSLSLTTPEQLGTGQVLLITPTITVA